MRACLQARSRWRPSAAPDIRRPGGALDETQQAEDGDCTNADLIVGGQAANQEGADTHGHQADDQRGLAAHAIAEVAEDQRAQRAGDEGDGEGQQAHQQCDGGVVLRGEEDVREVVCRGGAVGVEVIEFDGGTDHRRGDHGLDRIAYQGSGFTWPPALSQSLRLLQSLLLLFCSRSLSSAGDYFAPQGGCCSVAVLLPCTVRYRFRLRDSAVSLVSATKKAPHHAGPCRLCQLDWPCLR